MAKLISSYGSIKCAASDTRLAEGRPDYAVENRRAYEGDLILVEVLRSHGAYDDVENLQGRSERLYKGDLFIGVLGNRASLRYLSGSIPKEGIDLSDDTDLRLLSNGGIISIADESPAYLGEPMPLRSLGVLVDGTETVNTIARARHRETSPTVGDFPPLILVGASATDSGKTTFAANLIASLTGAGTRVASAKLSGTGCLEDVLAHKDAGARWIADFPDVGLPSTYTSATNYEPAVRDLLNRLSAADPDVIVAELGGDILWANVPTLFRMEDIMSAVQSIVLIPNDPVAAVGARVLLDNWGVTAPVTWAIPPTRNPTTYRARMSAFVPGNLIDTRSSADIEEFARQVQSEWRVHP